MNVNPLYVAPRGSSSSRVTLNLCYQFQIFHFVNLLSLDKWFFHCLSTSHMLRPHVLFMGITKEN